MSEPRVEGGEAGYMGLFPTNRRHSPMSVKESLAKLSWQSGKPSWQITSGYMINPRKIDDK